MEFWGDRGTVAVRCRCLTHTGKETLWCIQVHFVNFKISIALYCITSCCWQGNYVSFVCEPRNHYSNGHWGCLKWESFDFLFLFFFVKILIQHLLIPAHHIPLFDRASFASYPGAWGTLLMSSADAIRLPQHTRGPFGIWAWCGKPFPLAARSDAFRLLHWSPDAQVCVILVKFKHKRSVTLILGKEPHS